MNNLKYLVFLFVIVVFMSNCLAQRSLADVKEEVATTDYSKVKIKEIPVAMQCWTFRNLSFMETLEKVKKFGIKIP